MTCATQFETPFSVFLASANEDDFIIFEDPARETHFVQYKICNRVVYGEVSSRQWEADGSGKPLSDAAEFALLRMGFTHGGRARNYCQDDLPLDAPYLAQLTEKLFVTAFALPAPERPAIRTTVPELLAWAARHAQAAPTPRPPDRRPVCPCGYDHDDEPPLKASPGLAARALRAMRSNFMDQQLHCEDRQKFRGAVEAVRSFEDLPDWAQDWILKAEEGPIF